MTKCQVFYTKKAMFFYDITFFDFFTFSVFCNNQPAADET